MPSTTKPTFGIMQGRLSPPEEGRFQSFPRHHWRQEFALAREAGIDYIECIYDEYGATANPLTTDAGMDELNSLKEIYGIATPALCGDWFMDFHTLCSALLAEPQHYRPASARRPQQLATKMSRCQNSLSPALIQELKAILCFLPSFCHKEHSFWQKWARYICGGTIYHEYQ